MDIKYSSLKQVSFYEHTWEIVIYMVIAGNGCLGPDIWLETPNQGTGTEKMIFTTWYKEIMK